MFYKRKNIHDLLMRIITRGICLSRIPKVSNPVQKILDRSTLDTERYLTAK